MISAWLAGSWAEMANAADAPEARSRHREAARGRYPPSRNQNHPSGDPITTRSKNRRYTNRTKYIGQRIDAPLGELEIWVEWEMPGARIVLDCAAEEFENSRGSRFATANSRRATLAGPAGVAPCPA